jgi:hypothetical protein
LYPGLTTLKTEAKNNIVMEPEAISPTESVGDGKSLERRPSRILRASMDDKNWTLGEVHDEVLKDAPSSAGDDLGREQRFKRLTRASALEIFKSIGTLVAFVSVHLHPGL